MFFSNYNKRNNINKTFIKNLFNHKNRTMNKITFQDLYKYRPIKCCPHCLENTFVKFGKYRGLQRFKCTNELCKRTFTPKTNTLLSHSKKPLKDWIKYITLMNNNFSLRDCSKALNINLATAFYWRHKILFTQINNNSTILKDYVEVSKIMLKENFKGSKNIITKKKTTIFITCAMDNNNDIVSKVISRHSISLKIVKKSLSYNIDKNAILSCYNDRYLQLFSKEHNNNNFPINKDRIINIMSTLKKNQIVSPSILNQLNEINKNLPSNNIFIHKFSLKIKPWLIKFKGVSTKYLNNYLNWYIIDFKNDYETYRLNQINFLKNICFNLSFIKIKHFSKLQPHYET